MLKICYGLFLGLIVLASSACVTPTHASSTSPSGVQLPKVYLVSIQAAGLGGAHDEVVGIFNGSSEEIDVTDWCVVNKHGDSFACATPQDPSRRVFLLPKSHGVFTSIAHTNQAEIQLIGSMQFTSSSTQSGSITSSNDILFLVDSQDTIMDTFEWSTPIPSTKVFYRAQIEGEYVLTGLVSDWLSPMAVAPYLESFFVEREATIFHPHLTELLPDAEGSDTGKEFIELFNPHKETIDMKAYSVRIGGKTYSFPEGFSVEANSYKVVYNHEVKFTLVNTTSSVQLLYNGQPIGEAVSYAKPPTGSSWSLIDTNWTYVSLPTPNEENKKVADTIEPDETAPSPTQAGVSTLKPCRSDQYRSTETNRCRTVAQSTTISPCAADQERNSATGRCRKKEVAGAVAPCKEGQERNPETNRCRNIVKMSKVPHGVGVVQEEARSGVAWYTWLAIAGIIAAAAGYGVWEWRHEIAGLWKKLRRGGGDKAA